MKEWTAITTVKARPEAVLDVLTDPEAARRWAPIDFDIDGVRGRLTCGSRAYVSGRLAGREVGFEVEVHEAVDGRLYLSADGPIGFDVRSACTFRRASERRRILLSSSPSFER